MKTLIRISVVLLFVTLARSTKGQVAGGIEAAVTTTSVKISDIDNEFTKVIKGNGIMGFEGGLFLRVGMGPLYLKPKLLLEYQSGTLFYTTNGSEQNVNFHAGKLVIPVLVGLKIFPPVLGLEAGPVYNNFLFATKDFNGNQIDLKKGGLGYRIGLNATLSILNLTVSYQGIKNSGSITSGASYENPDQLIFGVGIEF